jgi:large subunit ribosomal protein L18
LSAHKREKIRIQKRKRRVRGKISGTQARPRLSVFRSSKQIYVQAIADDVGQTLSEASSLSQEIKDTLAGLKKVEVAREVGKLISKKLQGMGVLEIVFDRGSYLYHGRVKALAEAARESGLKF